MKKKSWKKAGKIFFNGGILFLVFTLLWLNAAFSRQQAFLTEKEIPKRVILISIDTVRSDKVGVYGASEQKSPYIDGMAEKGVQFINALTPLPRTTQALASLLTGLHPVSHHVRNLQSPLSDRCRTIAEILSEYGMICAAFVDHPLNLLAKPRGMNLGQGMKDFQDFYRGAHDKSKEWITEHKNENYFLWIHYFDPHWPYRPGRKYRFDCRTDENGAGWKKMNELIKETSRGDIIFNNQWDKDVVEYCRSLYLGEIAQCDGYVGEIMKLITDLGDMKDTLFIIVSDHGESLGEHNYYFEHGEVVYDQVMKIPLIFYGCGVKANTGLVPHSVTIMDVMPTILDLLGKPVPAELDGSSLSHFLVANKSQSEPDDQLTLFGETGRTHFKQNPIHGVRVNQGRHRMVRTDQLKVITIPGREQLTYQAFDLTKDPEEKSNIYDPQSEALQSLTEMTENWFDNHLRRSRRLNGDDRNAASDQEIDEEMKEALRKLGYIE